MKTETQSTNTQHTPRRFGQRLYDLIDLTDGQPVARFDDMGDCARARIALNSHDALVEALEWVANMTEGDAETQSPSDLADDINEARRKARAALAQAKGGAQ